jgi:diaminopimelate decarboxylase
LIGLHLHIGSQISQAKPFVRAIRRVETLVQQGRRFGLPLEWLNLGGGLGIIYRDERPQTPQAFAKSVLPLLTPLRVRLILEPGRFIVGNAGVLVTEVLYVKRSHGRQFAVVDAGMNDLLRPALYGAYHEVAPTTQDSRLKTQDYDVVGPVCESADVLARNRRLPQLEPGEFLAVLGAGAYGSTMASNYNGRLRPAEVLVRGHRWALIRRRDTLQDLVRHDVMPKTLLS